MSDRIDVLSRDGFIETIELLVNMLADKRQGCCFGLDGDWGCGKTFVLNELEERLRNIQLEETSDNKFYIFHYDCWKYDYYDEPAIAIISSMLEAVDRENCLVPKALENASELSVATVKKMLRAIASELCKNKIGIDLVEIASDVLQEHDSSKGNEFDSLYGFKRALDKTRTGIQEIANEKTVVIVVDELDRCLPSYAIKVLERLHHIFHEVDNVIVIISMDKKQLSHSIHEIYGDIEIDTYLRKFISFKVSLGNGTARSFSQKYQTYFSMFDYTAEETEKIEQFFTDILVGLDMRTQERIFTKAEIIHDIIRDDDIRDCSFMTFEVLYLTVSLRTKKNHLRWLSKIWVSTFSDYKNMLGNQYYSMLNEYGKSACSRVQNTADRGEIHDTFIGKTFFWLANMYEPYQEGFCKPYFYTTNQKYIDFVHRFAGMVNVIDCD